MTAVNALQALRRQSMQKSKKKKTEVAVATAHARVFEYIIIYKHHRIHVYSMDERTIVKKSYQFHGFSPTTTHKTSLVGE
jgi:hypothetical protein